VDGHDLHSAAIVPAVDPRRCDRLAWPLVEQLRQPRQADPGIVTTRVDERA
jgi:hypothetical protein